MTFSVIVPVYNVAPYLKECLDSVLAQTFIDWVCICVDDGSTDGSSAILDEYAARDSRFRVAHQSNMGVGAARNKGLDLANGDWVTFLDADDVYNVRWLQMAFESITRAKPDLLVQGLSRSASVLQNCCAGRSKETVLVGRREIDGWLWRQMAYDRSACKVFMRRDCGKGCLFPLGVSYCEDALWLIRAFASVEKVCVSDFNGYYYRTRSNSSRAQKLSAKERLAFFEACRDIHVENDYRQEVSHFLWENLLAWEAWHDKMCSASDGDVRAAYLATILKVGVSSKDIKWHWRVPHSLYVHHGVVWPVHATRRILKWLKSFS